MAKLGEISLLLKWMFISVSISINEVAAFKLGEVILNIEAETTEGSIKFHEWLGDRWGILFSYPADYTPVSTTELAKAAQLVEEFEKRGCKLIALSCDSVESHIGWIEDIKVYSRIESFPFPIIADDKRDMTVELGLLDPDERHIEPLPLTTKGVFIVGPDKKLKFSMLAPATTGMNLDEILRILDSLQLAANKNVATPANWKAGEDCMVPRTVKPEELTTLFPKGVTVQEVPSGKEYLRFTPQPE